MSLKQRIIDDFKQAFKEKDLEKKSVLSTLQAEMKNKEIELQKREEGLNDEELIEVIKKSLKQRYDSVEQYKNANRDDLAQKEQTEAAILEEYLPEQLSAENLERAVREVIEEVGASTKADIGKVMGAAMKKLRGQADGTKVREAAEKMLQ